MGGKHTPSVIMDLINANCNFVKASSLLDSVDMADFRPALLNFMATVTPNSDVQLDILRNFDEHVNKLSITQTFAPSSDMPEFHVSEVPDAVNPVKAKLAYTQIPNQQGDATELHLVWKVCLRS